MVALFSVFPLYPGRTAQPSNTSVSAIIIHWWGNLRNLFGAISFFVVDGSLPLWTCKINLSFGRCMGKGHIFLGF